MKTISLILTTYNSSHQLTRTLESIERQDYPQIVFFVNLPFQKKCGVPRHPAKVKAFLRPLKDNGVKGAALIDVLRTCRVLWQFVKTK